MFEVELHGDVDQEPGMTYKYYGVELDTHRIAEMQALKKTSPFSTQAGSLLMQICAQFALLKYGTTQYSKELEGKQADIFQRNG